MTSRKEFMDALYREYSGKIFDFLYKYSSGNPDVAMDLMQDTFLNFFRKYSDSDLDKEQAIRLLYTIARNRSINHSRKFSTVKESGNPEMQDFQEQKLSFVRKAELKDLEERLLVCLDELEEDERYALILRFMEDYNLTAIAEIMDISVSTASRLIVKATAKVTEIAERKNLKP
ncbi:sigma-70 family RNA polymerase sigma factor [Leptospira gomenensis]|uniref:Sigma-70 family RNA polymerase sigma factor n=2 Tax=Leptospira gomenensis TaxID=2484974 RepID=A0A5F1YQG4_9LEPT|nr:sigma-70 family RNA polymerase sigma factor [Leptospira gomenensis]TGK38299.1 sigma-70 family RNA polymerase sigma factor [Leptospira gomenensis]TGK52113.1 sigma-70 family RNA polymerase sigma factor [Leptospira gomenensis]TGK59838.1 sigma-70 family RNA polymerase sigma factor [Leptospira gomenensis]